MAPPLARASPWKHLLHLMINLRHRSHKKELLDNDDIPFSDIKINMQELDSINRKLGGHQITLKGIKSLLAGCSNKTSLTICEIGCGGGDNLNAISKFCNKNNIAANFIGILTKK